MNKLNIDQMDFVLDLLCFFYVALAMFVTYTVSVFMHGIFKLAAKIFRVFFMGSTDNLNDKDL